MNTEIIQFDLKKHHLEIYNSLSEFSTKNKIKTTFQYVTLKDGSKFLEIYFNNKFFNKLHKMLYSVLTSKNTYSFKDGYFCIN